MNRYEKYKETGVEWIGEIPEHWETKRLKYLLDIYGRIGFRGYTIEDIVHEGEGAISLSPSNIKNNTLSLEDRTYISWEKYEESPEIKIYEGDIIFVKTGSTIGKIAIIPSNQLKLTLNPQMVVFKNLKLNNKFLFYLFATPNVKRFLETQMIGGAAQTISQEKINLILVSFPPIQEQKVIANYLDAKTEQIDKLIANKQQLIELLKEERTAFINKAVTGEGKKWEKKKLKYLIKIKSGDGIKSDDIDFNGTYPVYGGNGIMGYTEKFNSENVDIIIGRVGAKCGNVRMVSGKKWISDNALVASMIGDNNLQYLTILLEALNLNTLANQNAQPLITGTLVKEKVCALPAKEDQLQIIQYISNETNRIKDIISEIETEIVLLQEYRTSLISEVVTGKQKVI